MDEDTRFLLEFLSTKTENDTLIEVYREVLEEYTLLELANCASVLLDSYNLDRFQFTFCCKLVYEADFILENL